ncbi:MAG: insulinase family protein [Treponema sp.]
MDTLVHGFTIVSKTPLPEMNAIGIYARHERTGLELYHILNDDEENLFAFAFMTPPANSSGVAHIIEHSVLCGSKNYPIKDPFLTLAKQSVKTFLNAMTFPDKTVYPASSIIEADYFNVMSVYGDAVFFPLLERATFEQEGYHLACDDKGVSTFSGVVLNEMRGAYADFESIMEKWARQSILQGTLYAHDSGGYPPDIVHLTYEDFLAFHKNYYHPVNCKVFLYGNIPTEKQMVFLNERFLSKFTPAAKPPLIPTIAAYPQPQSFSVTAPAGEGKRLDTISVMLNWLLPESKDIDALMDVILMEEVLLGHDGALLQKLLLETDLSEDVYVYNGAQTELKNMCFTIGLVDLTPNAEEAFQQFVFDSLRTIVTNGIDQKLIETALHSLEFAHREIIRSGGPFSLILMRRVLRGWLHGTAPDAALRVIPAFERLKVRVKTQEHYVEKLIGTFLLDNPHRALVSVHPDIHFAETIDRQLAAQAAQRAKQFAETQKQPLQRQNTKEVPVPESIIAHIAKQDLPALLPPIAEQLEYIGSVPVITHALPTNEISYITLAVPIDGFSEQEQYFFTLYTAMLSSMGTQTKPWDSVASEFAYVTGGLSAVLVAAGNRGAGTPLSFFDGAIDSELIAGRPWLFIRTKILPEYIAPALHLVFSYLHTIQFNDEKRLKDIFIQVKNDMDPLPTYAGQSLAATYAGATHAETKKYENIWFGIPQIRFLRKRYAELEAQPESIAELAARFNTMHQKILQAGMLVKLCTTDSLTHKLKQALVPHLHAFSFPTKLALHAEPLSAVGNSRFSGFPTIVQVGFSALAVPFTNTVHDAYGTALVYAQWLETGALWEKIRMAGGAYGVSAYVNILAHSFFITSYRDPQPLQSVCRILATLKETDALSALSDSELDALITGTYSNILQPQTPSQKSAAAFFRFLNGITHEMRQQTASGILGCTQANLKDFARALAQCIPRCTAGLVGTEQMLTAQTTPITDLPPLQLFPPL